MCGEKPAGLQFLIRWMGSPPHVRGKEDGFFQVCELIGITPACAGKSTSCCGWDTLL